MNGTDVVIVGGGVAGAAAAAPSPSQVHGSSCSSGATWCAIRTVATTSTLRPEQSLLGDAEGTEARCHAQALLARTRAVRSTYYTETRRHHGHGHAGAATARHCGSWLPRRPGPDSTRS